MVPFGAPAGAGNGGVAWSTHVHATIRRQKAIRIRTKRSRAPDGRGQVVDVSVQITFDGDAVEGDRRPFCRGCGSSDVIATTGADADRRWRCYDCGQRFDRPELRLVERQPPGSKPAGVLEHYPAEADVPASVPWVRLAEEREYTQVVAWMDRAAVEEVIL